MAKSSPRRPPGRTPPSQPAALEGNRHWRERKRVRRVGPAGGSGEGTHWEALPEWGQHAAALLALLVVALVFLSPVVTGGRTLVGGDTVQWRGTAEAMLDYERASGTDALWAPNVFGGMPGYLIHYPLAVPGLDTAVQGLRGIGLWPLAHLLVLMAGTYALVFVLTRGKLAAALAALAFGLTTYLPLILTAGHNTKFIALAWAPWLLLAFAGVLYRPDAIRPLGATFLALLFALALALNLRAQHVQITYYVAFAAAVWWLVEGVWAVRLGQVRRFVASTALLAIGALLGLLMVAQPYLVQWEYKAFTVRGGDGAGGGGGMAWDTAMAWSQGIGELLTLVVANAFGGGGQPSAEAAPFHAQIGASTYWGPKIFTAGPHYIGPLVLLLAVLGLAGVRRRAATALAIAAGLMTLFALGSSLPLVNRPMFEFFPLFASFRAPETWLVAVALVLAVLAGYGGYYLARREATDAAEARKTQWLYRGLAIGVATLGLLALVGPSLLPFEKEGEREQLAAAVAAQAEAAPGSVDVDNTVAEVLGRLRDERAGLFRRDALRGLGFLVAAGLLLWLYRTGRVPPWAMQLGLFVLIAWDLGGVGRRYFNEENPALRARSSTEAAIERYGFDAFLQERVREAGGPGHFRVYPLALGATGDGRSSYFYESVGGYHGAKLALMQAYFDRLLPEPDGGLNANALGLLSARYVVAQRPLPGLNPVYQDEQTGLLVLENPDALPRAFLVDRAEVVGDEGQLVERLRQPATDLRRTALLSGPLPDGIDPAAYSGPDAPPGAPVPADTATAATVPDTTAAPAAGSAATRVRLVRFTPRDIVWEVETDRPRLLVASEVYYPEGWRATVSDQPAPILRADYLLRAVPVPAGRHLVEMEFDPPSHRLGVLVSAGASLAVYLGALLLGGLLWYRRGHPKR